MRILQGMRKSCINIYVMKELIASLVSTQKGWIIRQILKYITVGGSALSAWLVSQGAEASNVELIVTGATTFATGAIEFALSKVASKIAAK